MEMFRLSRFQSELRKTLKKVVCFQRMKPLHIQTDIQYNDHLFERLLILHDASTYALKYFHDDEYPLLIMVIAISTNEKLPEGIYFSVISTLATKMPNIFLNTLF